MATVRSLTMPAFRAKRIAKLTRIVKNKRAGTFYYIVPITRHGDIRVTITMVHKLTDRDLQEFYQTPISKAHRRQIIDIYHSKDFFDAFDYIRLNLIQRDPAKRACRYSELMGDLRHFEGVQKVGENRYEVELGS